MVSFILAEPSRCPAFEKFNADTVARLDRLAVISGAEAGHQLLNILQRIHWRIPVLAGTLGFAIFPCGFGFLDMSGVGKHDGAKVPGRCCRKDGTVESVFCEQRQFAGVIRYAHG